MRRSRMSRMLRVSIEAPRRSPRPLSCAYEVSCRVRAKELPYAAARTLRAIHPMTMTKPRSRLVPPFPTSWEFGISSIVRAVRAACRRTGASFIPHKPGAVNSRRLVRVATMAGRGGPLGRILSSGRGNGGSGPRYASVCNPGGGGHGTPAPEVGGQRWTGRRRTARRSARRRTFGASTRGGAFSAWRRWPPVL